MRGGRLLFFLLLFVLAALLTLAFGLALVLFGFGIREGLFTEKRQAVFELVPRGGKELSQRAAYALQYVRGTAAAGAAGQVVAVIASAPGGTSASAARLEVVAAH